MPLEPTPLAPTRAARGRSGWLLVTAALLAAALAITLALALTAPLAHAGDPPCPDGRPPLGDLGILELTGLAGFSINGDDPAALERFAVFRTEPQIVRLANGAGSGLLKEGDAIVAVDGALITTREGGKRLSNLAPGRPVRLSIRREGRRIEIQAVPTARCAVLPAWVDTPEPTPPPEPPTPPAAPGAPAPTTRTTWSYSYTPPAPPAPPAPETRPTPIVLDMSGDAERAADDAGRAAQLERLTEAHAAAVIASRGWFGLGIDCEDCRWQALPADSGVMWISREYPTIYRVDPGSPAETAGLQRGDVLIQIDGVSLLTPEGGRRFGAVKPGQHVRWSYRRDGRPAVANAVAALRPGALGMYAQSMAQLQSQLRQMRQSDTKDAEMQRRVAQMETQMKQSETQLLRDRSRLVGLQRLRWTGSVGDADVEVKGIGNVTVTTDAVTGEIVVVTNDATIHIKPSETPGTPQAPKAPKTTPKPPKPPKS
jgi:hypothetical protein